MFKSMEVEIKKIALNVINEGRPSEDVSLDTSDGGLLQSILGGFDSTQQPLILVKASNESNAFGIDECIEKTKAKLAEIDFGMTEGETPKEKSKTITTIGDDDQPRKHVILPSALQLDGANYRPSFICIGGNNRTLGGLVAGQVLEGGFQIAHAHVYENYQDAVEAARKENILKDIGVKKMTKLDHIMIVQRGMDDFTIKRECDLKNKLKISSRHLRQSVFGPAAKGRNIDELQAQLMAGELDCGHSKLPVERLNQKIGPKFLDCHDYESVKAMLAEEVSESSAIKTRCMSGAEIKDMVKLASGPLAELLEAIATNNSGEAYKLMERIQTALK